jgi:hypothetical protein
MKTSHARFADLRRLLLDLGFSESEQENAWRFEHLPSGTVFLFRAYKPNDPVTIQDVASTRTHLDWRGLLPSISFDDAFTKTPA